MRHIRHNTSHTSIYRSIIPLLSTSAMLSKTTKTASLSLISCSAVIYAVRPLHPFLPLHPFHTPPSAVHLDRLGTLPETTIRFYVAELSSALAFLHENHIMHRCVSFPLPFVRSLNLSSEISSLTISSLTSVDTLTSRTLTSLSIFPIVAYCTAWREAWPTWHPRFSQSVVTLTRSTGGPSVYAHTNSFLAVARSEAKPTVT